jgi:hypothetical protein
MVKIRPVELRDVDTIYQFRLDEEVMFWAAGGFGNAIPAREQLVEEFRKQSPLDTQRLFVIEVQGDGQADRFTSATWIGWRVGPRSAC